MTAPEETVIKGKQKKNINKSKKSTWRRIDHPEIDGTAALDVRDTLINRTILESRTREKGTDNKKRKRNDEVDLKHHDFFKLDATGIQIGLSRSIQKDLTKRVKGAHHLSDYQVKAVEKTLQSIPAREQQLKNEAETRSLITAVPDLWGSPINNNDKNSSSAAGGVLGPSRKRSRIPAVIRAPAVKLPFEGQSVNPLPEQHAVRKSTCA